MRNFPALSSFSKYFDLDEQKSNSISLFNKFRSCSFVFSVLLYKCLSSYAFWAESNCGNFVICLCNSLLLSALCVSTFNSHPLYIALLAFEVAGLTEQWQQQRWPQLYLSFYIKVKHYEPYKSSELSRGGSNFSWKINWFSEATSDLEKPQSGRMLHMLESYVILTGGF